MSDSSSQSLWDVGRTLVWEMTCAFLPEIAIGDAYEPRSLPVPREGHRVPEQRVFADYLAGPSSVAVDSLAEIEAFLRASHYVATPARNSDWTLLASQFETDRRGNCLDHSLWAWRKLRELGQPSEIVVGVVDPHETPLMRHAWVVFERDGQRLRLETITKEAAVPMVQRIRPNVDEYWPELGVNRNGVPFAYAGVVRFTSVSGGLPWQD